jgi:hypothetical protein
MGNFSVDNYHMAGYCMKINEFAVESNKIMNLWPVGI